MEARTKRDQVRGGLVHCIYPFTDGGDPVSIRLGTASTRSLRSTSYGWTTWLNLWHFPCPLPRGNLPTRTRCPMLLLCMRSSSKQTSTAQLSQVRPPGYYDMLDVPTRAVITVRQSKNPCLVGLSGIIVHETENAFKIVTKKDQLKRLCST